MNVGTLSVIYGMGATENGFKKGLKVKIASKKVLRAALGFGAGRRRRHPRRRKKDRGDLILAVKEEKRNVQAGDYQNSRMIKGGRGSSQLRKG